MEIYHGGNMIVQTPGILIQQQMTLDMETKKLFDEDAYAVEFDAQILSVCSVRDGIELILDRTLFFPEEGGQTPDTGTLGGFPVVDVQLEGGVIRHVVRFSGKNTESGKNDSARSPETDTEIDKNDSAQSPEKNAKSDREERGDSGMVRQDLPFSPGQTVHGRIDFAHRFSNMQNHSGEHILSGLVHGRFGYDNVGFHLSDNTVTLDFNGPLSDEDILWLENAANRVVWDNKEIHACYPSPEELEKITYRSKKEIDGPLRIVEIPGVDICACCAPHVRRTGEIGMIKIIRTLRERSGIRLTILCGSRALAYLQQLQKAAEDVSHLTNMPREEIAAGTSRILEDNERLRRRGALLEARLTEAMAAAVPADQEHVFLFAQEIGNIAQRRLVNSLCETHPGYCGVFAGTEEEGYKYILGAGSKKEDARVLNACLHKLCGARGGGKPAMVQGSVKAQEQEIRTALQKALFEIEENS